MAAHTSVVKWFDAKKGYGFILHPEDNSDVFVHYSQINTDKRFRTLKTGEKVSFDLVKSDNGYHAHNVTAIENVEGDAHNSDATDTDSFS